MIKVAIYSIDYFGHIYSEDESGGKLSKKFFLAPIYRFFDIWGLSAKMPASYLDKTISLPSGIACDGEYVYVSDKERFEENMLSSGIRPLSEEDKVICRERATEKF